MATTEQEIQKELNQKAAQKLQQDNQKKMEQDQANMAANNQGMLNPNQKMEQNTKNMDVKKDPNKNHDLNQICDDWLKRYKKQKPDFNEDENKLKVDQEKGRITLAFKDAQAEEDFLRDVAKQGLEGKVTMGNDVIALTKNGELIDPRTNKAFPEGGYKDLVEQLRAGKDYKDLQKPTPAERSLSNSTEKPLSNSPENSLSNSSGESLSKSPVKDIPLGTLSSTKSATMENMPNAPQQETTAMENAEPPAPSITPSQS
ncbi:hypothetical protein [Legionella cincinnatiensis]|uniref:Dot/Icm secretion system substrate n=1 Tax=Legionella cincinnatiensis TaxID=28085 RepID=A0A378IQT8_9GAMM|nr:hypothetical protein [Legionella cincinnatiensis]KTC83666.1 hypothetical protein Lcin_2353 [Legionella cincinnatiensis]STX34374.1 Uncharacterised protein [Legionella cincinnatiensis]